MNEDTVEVKTFSNKDNPFKIIKYKDHILVDGLFRMYDERGFPLADSIRECRKRGMIPCLKQFIADAIRSGWTEERAQKYVAEAQRDST